MHFTDFMSQMTGTDILISFSGLNKWLHTHHAFSFHFTGFGTTIRNQPMSAKQLNRKDITIYDGDPIGERELSFSRVTVRFLVRRFYLNFNPSGNFGMHRDKFRSM